MAKPHRATRSEDLLRERELQGVRSLFFVRGMVVLTVVATVWVIGANLFEKVATTVIALLVLLALAWFVRRIAERRRIVWIGLAGCAIDMGLITALPIVWYLSVGGSEVPASYLLKTQITALTLGLIALNALAIRPLYPLVVTAGGIAIHVAFFLYAQNDPRTLISSNYLDATMGPALSPGLVMASLIITAIAGLVLGFTTLIARRTLVQGVRLEVANAQLGRYFSPGVVSRISGDAEQRIGVGGRTQEVAVMFCDIRDFTSITEPLPPDEVVDFLSQYHRRMVEEVFRFGGTIDKFIGDAIMVTFGTPEPWRGRRAERALRAGPCHERRLLAGAQRQNVPPGVSLAEIRHGIGLHYGLGDRRQYRQRDQRLEYTVMGDTVNVASRIQDACKATGESFLISDAVARRLPPDIQVRALPEQRVKGRQEPVQILAVTGQAEPLPTARP